jgi:RNA polymerase sigma factor (sigma-70 family)
MTRLRDSENKLPSPCIIQNDIVRRMSDLNFNLDEFRHNPDPHLKQWYREYRTPFVRWAQSRSSRVKDDALADIFQRAMIVFWENVVNERLIELTSSPKTYLYAIGRNLLRSEMRMVVPDELPDGSVLPADLLGLDYGVEHKMIRDEENAKLHRALDVLGDPCRKLLRLTFFDELKSADIAPLMDYASEEVVRTRRKMCMKRLRELWS